MAEATITLQQNLFPYERKFLRNEIHILGGEVLAAEGDSWVVSSRRPQRLGMLTYANSVRLGARIVLPVQALREETRPRQSTRYGPHGLHEYKGKFNPQMPRSLMVQGGIRRGMNVLDPFCGSGTTLVEASLIGANSTGIELNPIAAMISKGKVAWLSRGKLPVPTVSEIRKESWDYSTAQENYLRSWFPKEIFVELQHLRAYVERQSENPKAILLALLSNQLRSHSLQDPADLRIRRRKEVPSGASLIRAFQKSVGLQSQSRARWHREHGSTPKAKPNVVLGDSRTVQLAPTKMADFVVTSPPYATALPYVDTYRLSGVSLGLIEPKAIQTQERALIGARDVTPRERKELGTTLARLPGNCAGLVKSLQEAVGADPNAGFRRQAVPAALARYLALMSEVLGNIQRLTKAGAQHRWVVGPNRTTIAGKTFSIQTPELLAELAMAHGYLDVQVEAVDAYPRYHMHARNSIRQESIVSFESP